MFGSKTTRLFAILDRYKYQKRNVIAFKPGIDDRYCETSIVTHSGASMPARVVNSGMEIHQFVNQYISLMKAYFEYLLLLPLTFG